VLTGKSATSALGEDAFARDVNRSKMSESKSLMAVETKVKDK